MRRAPHDSYSSYSVSATLQIEMGIFIPVGSELFRGEGRVEHVFVSGIASEKKRERGDWSSLVKGPQPSSILPQSCFAMLQGEDGGMKGMNVECVIEIDTGRN